MALVAETPPDLCRHRWSIEKTVSHSLVSKSLQYHGPARLFFQWNSPGKNNGGGCHSPLQGIFSTQGSTGVSCIAGRFIIIWATSNTLDGGAPGPGSVVGDPTTVQGSPAEAFMDSCLLCGQGHWIPQPWKLQHAGISPFEGGHLYRHYPYHSLS